MKPNTENLQELVERQLDLESGVADALEQLNDEMASLLDQAGIYGPSKNDLNTLSPLVENLRKRQSDSQKARESLNRWSGNSAGDSAGDFTGNAGRATPTPISIRTIIGRLPANESVKLDAKRQQIFHRVREAQQRLTANQVVVFYSTEFHRRYLLGVLQCDVDETNYKADGQAFKLPPEKIIGRNC